MGMVAVDDFDFLSDSGVSAESLKPDPPAWHSHPATKKQIDAIKDMCDTCGYDTYARRRRYLRLLGFNGAWANLTKGQASDLINALTREVGIIQEESAWMPGEENWWW